ncbi:MAG: hypothetical protein CMJ28_02920 [Phycisphaerae bacterium]|nr:hypothetical protein [Phycisphaerae bacterium]
MTIYGILRALRGGWGLVCFWFYTIAFLVALPTVFLFPPATIVMFGSALLSLPFAVLIGMLTRLLYRAWCRRSFAQGRCPACGVRMQSCRDSTLDWKCEFCDRVFDSDAEELMPRTNVTSRADVSAKYTS